MIEAINSSLASAAVTQKAAVQAVSKPVTVEKTVPVQAENEVFYLSRNVRVDNSAKVAVLEFRNPLNGDVKTQIPTEAQLKAYQISELAE
jgi:hypothetical protein